MPFEFTYAPLVPGLTSLIASVRGIPGLGALHNIMGAVYALGPVLLFVGLWRLTRSPWPSFAAAIVYSLLSPALLFAPNQGFSLSTLWYAERLYLIADWDETPHMVALALWPLAVLCLFRILETRRIVWVAGGALLMSAMVYASAFGATLLVLAACCVIGAMGTNRSNLVLIAITGVLTYLASSIAMPPSLMGAVREAADTHGFGWSVTSLVALAATVLVWTLLLPQLNRRVQSAYLRFFILFTITCLLIVCLYDFGGRLFLPQPGRYKCELSLGLSVVVCLGLYPYWRRLRPSVRFALCALLIGFASEQVVSLRRWAKQDLRGQDITRTIEYRAATWIDGNLPENARVMLPGSMAQWFNAFTQHTQWTGSSWATAYNQQQQRALNAVYQEQGNIRTSLIWLRAFGVGAVAVSGEKSPEFWKPFGDKRKYDGKLDVLWQVDDTTLYRVPRRVESHAHALPAGVRSGKDWKSVTRYVEALENERLPGLSIAWPDRNHAVINGEVRAGEAVSIQVNHHNGWKAMANGERVPIERDGLGLMWIRPACAGPCRIELSYWGGMELVVCRIVSAAMLCALTFLFIWGWITHRTIPPFEGKPDEEADFATAPVTPRDRSLSGSRSGGG